MNCHDLCFLFCVDSKFCLLFIISATVVFSSVSICFTSVLLSYFLNCISVQVFLTVFPFTLIAKSSLIAIYESHTLQH